MYKRMKNKIPIYILLTLCILLMSLVVVSGEAEVQAANNDKVILKDEDSLFTDVLSTSWQYTFAQYAYENGLMAGKGKEESGKIIFDPNRAIPREEFVQVLYNASGKPSVSIENKFPDVKNAWYKNAVLWANQNDIANGKGNGNFGIAESISRQDLALMLYKYARLYGYDLSVKEGEINKYADGNKVSNYAKTAMDWAITHGILSGKGNRGEDISTFRLDPTGTATRAECAAMLKNFMETGYEFGIAGLMEDDSMVTWEGVLSLEGTLTSNHTILSVKGIIYSDENAEKKEFVVNGTENWSFENLPLDLGNNYITITAYGEIGGSGSKTIKIIRHLKTEGTITVNHVNEHNCVEMSANVLEITGTADANKDIESIECIYNSVANEEMRLAKAEGTNQWKFNNLSLDIGTNYLKIVAKCVDGSTFFTEVKAVRYSTEVVLADNVVLLNPEKNEEYSEIQNIYDRILDVWTEDFDTEDTSDDELNLAVLDTNPIYQKIVAGELEQGDIFYIPANDIFLTGFTVKYLYMDDIYEGDVKEYNATTCQVIHLANAGYTDLFDNSQDICITAKEIAEENPIAFVYFPYAEYADTTYREQMQALKDAGNDVVDGRRFQYQNFTEDKIKINIDAPVLKELKVELDDLVIFDFDGKSSTTNDRLSLSGSIRIEDIDAIFGLEMHPSISDLKSAIIPQQVISRLEYTKKEDIKVSYGGKAELKDLMKDVKGSFNNKVNVTLFGEKVELEGIDTEGRIYLASVGLNLGTLQPCEIKDLDEAIEPLLVVSLYQTLEGTIEAEAYVSIETETYYKNGFNFQKKGFEGALGSVEDNKGTHNFPITIPSLSGLGNGTEYEINIYDYKGKSKTEPTATPEWTLNAGMKGKATMSSGLGMGLGTMVCGIMPISFDVNLEMENTLSGEGKAKLSNYGTEEDAIFELFGKKIYASLEGEYEFSTRLGLAAEPNMRLQVCVSDVINASISMPEINMVDMTFYEGGISSTKHEGIVCDSVTKLPVANAKVVLKRYNSTGWGNTHETVTDQEGYFKLPDILVVDGAEYKLEITKQDYKVLETEMQADDIGKSDAEYNLVCTLEHPYVKGIVSVATEDGNAGERLYYATVTYQGVSGTETAGKFASAKTDSNGNYDIGYLPEGEYTVTVSRAGYKTETINIPLVINESGETDFVLEEETFKFSGYVYYVSDEGEQLLLEGATVKLTRMIGSMEETYTIKTDSNGYFEFAKVLASNGSIVDNLAEYALTVEAVGYNEYTSTVILNKDMEKNITLFKVSEKSNVEGYVTPADKQGLKDVNITFTNVFDSEVVYSAVTDGEGYYEIEDMIPSSYIVTVEKKDFQTVEKEIILVEGDNQCSFELEKATGSIKGNIISRASGKNINQELKIYVYDANDNLFGEFGSNLDGTFEIALAMGSYTVDIVDESEPMQFESNSFNIVIETDTILEQNIEILSYYGVKVDEGDCGKNIGDTVKWTTYDTNDDGVEDTLVISGIGEMRDYDYYNRAPWKKLNIQHLILEEGITVIGNEAFYECNKIKGELCFPSSLKCIGNGSFYYCSGLSGELSISNTITSIGDYAFSGCSGFSGDLIIPDSLTFIRDDTFSCCEGFNGKLVIPDSIVSIGDRAFMWCEGLNGNLDIPNSVKSIGYGAFWGCGGFSGDLVIPNSITVIDGMVFNECTGFNGKLYMPTTITSIGDGAFTKCTGLNGELVISDGVTSIGVEAFFKCSGFSGDLIIPNSVTSIGEGAFSECSGFNGNLTLSNNLTSIGNAAFANCSGFVGDLIIPTGVTSIGRDAFTYCSGFDGELSIPEGVTSIGANAFSLCKKFKGDLVIPNSVKKIDSYAFMGSGFDGELILSENVAHIGGYLFKGCGFNGELIVPASVSYIGEDAFACKFSRVTILNDNCGFESLKYYTIGCTTIVGRAGSSAERYAAENGLNFIVIE